MQPVDMKRLTRVRWAVRATLVLGVAASVVANVLHARQHPIAQAIAAWPPLALLLTVELISRVPIHRRWLAAVRLLATATIAGIAAWVSYWHMAGVAARYGEDPASAHLLPLSVDGLVLVASVSLVELAGRIRAAEVPLVAPLATPAPTAAPAAELPAELPPAAPDDQQVTAPEPAVALPAEVPPPTPAPASEGDQPARARKPAPASAPKRPFALTQQAAASMEAGGMTVAQIALALGVTERQVRNALKPVPVSVGAPDTPEEH